MEINMQNFQFVFGPVPSRRLGQSLGVSPIPDRTCNYSCTYCQLGRTIHMTNVREMFFPAAKILDEFERAVAGGAAFDVVTVVGEGEPTLYAGLGELLSGLKERTDKPVAVITNGALLYDEQVRKELKKADIVLPSFDAVSEEQYRRIDRPYGKLDYSAVQKGLIQFSHEYEGQLYLEIMLLGGMNCDDGSLAGFADLLKQIRYDRVYVNTPVRPPAEPDAVVAPPERIAAAVRLLGAISIDMLTAGSFASEIEDPLEAVISICQRHPMNQFEINSFLDSRGADEREKFWKKLENDVRISALEYKGILTYRATGGNK